MGSLLLERVVKIVLSALTISLSARLLTPTVFGELSFAVSVAALSSIPILMGLAHLFKIELDHGLPPSLLLPRLEKIRIPIYITSVGLWLFLLPSGSSASLLLAAIATHTISPDIYEVLLLKLGESKYLAATSFRMQLLDSTAKILLLVGTRSPLYFLLAEFLSRSLKAFLLRRKSTRLLVTHGADSSNPNDQSMPQLKPSKLLIKSFTLTISGLSAVAYLRSDQIMITQLLGATENGLYAAAASIAESFNFVPQTIMSFLSVAAFLPPPILFDLNKLSRIKNTIIWSGLIISLGLLAFSYQTVDILFGSAYLQTTTLLIFLSPIPLLWSISIYQSTVLMHLRKTSHDVIRNILAAVLNVTLNILLIPQIGLNGAAIATVSSLTFLILYPKLCLPDSP